MNVHVCRNIDLVTTTSGGTGVVCATYGLKAEAGESETPCDVTFKDPDLSVPNRSDGEVSQERRGARSATDKSRVESDSDRRLELIYRPNFTVKIKRSCFIYLFRHN